MEYRYFLLLIAVSGLAVLLSASDEVQQKERDITLSAAPAYPQLAIEAHSLVERMQDTKHTLDSLKVMRVEVEVLDSMQKNSQNSALSLRIRHSLADVRKSFTRTFRDFERVSDVLWQRAFRDGKTCESARFDSLLMVLRTTWHSVARRTMQAGIEQQDYGKALRDASAYFDMIDRARGITLGCRGSVPVILQPV